MRGPERKAPAQTRSAASIVARGCSLVTAWLRWLTILAGDPGVAGAALSDVCAPGRGQTGAAVFGVGVRVGASDRLSLLRGNSRHCGPFRSRLSGCQCAGLERELFEQDLINPFTNFLLKMREWNGGH